MLLCHCGWLTLPPCHLIVCLFPPCHLIVCLLFLNYSMVYCCFFDCIGRNEVMRLDEGNNDAMIFNGSYLNDYRDMGCCARSNCVPLFHSNHLRKWLRKWPRTTWNTFGQHSIMAESSLDRACRRLRNNDHTLLELDLRRNDKIRDEGVTALAHAMKGNTTVQSLWLSNNLISDEGVTTLAHALKGNTTLQRLSLGNNQISDEGVTALAQAFKGNTTLQALWLYNNTISDEGVTTLARLLNGYTKLSIYACGRWIKPSDKPKDTAAHDGEIAPFYDKLIKINKKDVNAATHLLGELSSFIDDVHEMKIYYTYVACYDRMGLIEKDVAGTFIKNGLRTVSTKCQDHHSVVIFKLINDKAKDDGYLTLYEFHDGDQLAERAGLQPMFESLADAICANTDRIEGLEANLVAVNKSVNQIRKGLRQKYRIEAVTGFIGAVINAISMGVGGGLVNAAAAFHTVIDFGDIDHMKESFAGNAALLEKVNEGLALADQIVVMAEDKLSDLKLKNVVNNEEDVVIGLVVAAKLVQQPNWSGNLGISPTHPPAGILGIGQTIASLLVFPGIIGVFTDIIGRLLFSLFKAGDNMFADAELDEEEESRLPVHAAIKFGFKNDLKELLERRDKVDVNQLDSKE